MGSSSLRYKTHFIKDKILPFFSINEWNNLTANIRHTKTVKTFLKIIIISEKKQNSLFPVYNALVVKLLACLN